MTTINLKPTREEQARIIAYVLSSHVDGNPNRFGDYWSMTQDEMEIIFEMWMLVDAIIKSIEAVGLGFDRLSKSVRKSIILAAYAQAKASH